MRSSADDILLVGSVPLESPGEVFKTCAAALGTHLRALPDGEVGARQSWIQCQAKLVFDGHPALQTVRRPRTADGLAPDYTDNWVFRLQPGHPPLDFPHLGYARWALESYRVFDELRQRNEIPRGLRFQVSIPTPLGACATFFEQPAERAAICRAYEPALLREVSEICRQIPAQDLAIQWDVCIEILEIAGNIALLPEDPWTRAAAQFERLAQAVPAAVLLGYHLCYGDLGHRHLVEPANLALSVRMANLLLARAARRVDWIHMPVPRERSDDAYFAPLKDLDGGAARIFLGLIHRHDGVAGALTRARAARRYLADFGVAAECGLGRREPATLAEVLTLHREVAERLAATSERGEAIAPVTTSQDFSSSTYLMPAGVNSSGGTMAFATILLDKQDLVGTLTLNRPEKLNAMTPGLMTEFAQAITQVEKDPEIKVLVIRGAGRAFSTGYDLTSGWGDTGGKPFTLDDDQRFLQRYIEHWLRLRDLPKPVISMVHGYCLAGATQLCISTDMIFVAEDAQVGFPSIPAGAGYVSSFWNWMVGPHRTKYLAFLPGSRITGKEAEAMGFATRAFAADRLEQETYSYAHRVAKVPAQKLRLEKLAINRAMDLRGFRVAVQAGAEFDAIFHFGPGNDEIRAVQKERGLRGAIKWYEEK